MLSSPRLGLGWGAGGPPPPACLAVEGADTEEAADGEDAEGPRPDSDSLEAGPNSSKQSPRAGMEGAGGQTQGGQGFWPQNRLFHCKSSALLALPTPKYLSDCVPMFGSRLWPPEARPSSPPPPPLSKSGPESRSQRSALPPLKPQRNSSEKTVNSWPRGPAAPALLPAFHLLRKRSAAPAAEPPARAGPLKFNFRTGAATGWLGFESVCKTLQNLQDSQVKEF